MMEQLIFEITIHKLNINLAYSSYITKRGMDHSKLFKAFY